MGVVTLGLVGPLASSQPSRAGDGVLEINQTCAVSTGCFPGDAPGYPVTIDGSAGRSYELTSDLVVPDVDANVDGISIDASFVSIDLLGFSIVRQSCVGATTPCLPPDGSIAAGIASFRDGVSVRNGSVVGMGRSGVTLGRSAHVESMRTRWNGSYGIQVSENSVVRSSLAHENGVVGVQAGSGSTVSNSIAYGNGRVGFLLGVACIVSRVSASANADAGVTSFVSGAFGDQVVTDTAAYGNGEDGFHLGGGATVQRSVAYANGGLGLRSSGIATYRESVFSANADGSVNLTGTPPLNLGASSCNGSPVCP